MFRPYLKEVLASGIVKSVTSGFAEMIVTSMAQTVARSQVMDILPPIISPKAEIFIKVIKDEEIYWSLFLHMFPAKVWLALYLVAVIISVILSTIKNVWSEGNESFMILKNLMDYLWFAFKANFGGSSNQVHQNFSSRIVTFTCLFIGSLIWMLYRASVTSVLSAEKIKLPFTDLERLFKSDYELIAPPRSYAISQLFVKGGEDSIYGRLYENNMKNTSFYPLNEGIGYIIRKPKSALISLGDPIRFYRNHHCEVSCTTKQ